MEQESSRAPRRYSNVQRIQYYSFPNALHMQIKYALPMQIWILKFTKLML